MVIEAKNHRYNVIYRREERNGYEIFCCQKLNEEQDQHYEVFRIIEPILIRKLILELTNGQQNEYFTDLYEYFSENGQLYLVFLEPQGTPFEEKVRDNGSLEERIEIGKAIFERLLLLSMPEYLLAELWHNGQILVSDHLEVSFHYRLDGIWLEQEEQERKIRYGIAGYLEQLFWPEIKLEKYPAICEWIGEIQDGKRKEIQELYQRYREICAEIKVLHIEGELQPHTFWFRVWDRIKKGLFYVKWGLGIVLILLLAGWLLYGILYPTKTEEFVKYSRIGWLDILD